MPDGFRIATAYVEVKPDLSGFKEKLKAALDGEGEVKAKVGVNVDDKDLDRARAGLDEFGKKNERAKAGVDTGDSRPRLDDLIAKLDEVGFTKKSAALSVKTDEAVADIDRVTAELDAYGVKKVTARADIDIGDAVVKLTALKEAQREVGESSDQVKARLTEFAEQVTHGLTSANVAYTPSVREMVTANEHFQNSFYALGGAARWEAEQRKGLAEADALLAEGRRASMDASAAEGVAERALSDVRLGSAGATQRLYNEERKLREGRSQGGGSGSGGFDQSSGGVGYWALQMQQAAAAAAIILPLIPALGGALAGLGGTAFVAGTAFEGIRQAFSDWVNLQSNAVQTGAQMALQQLSNTNAIISAHQQIVTSEHAYTDALFAEREAQVNLTNARIQARLTLQQLNNAEIDSKLSVKQASLDLKQAIYEQQLTDQNAMTTQLQRQQAALGVAEAERHLTEAKQNQVNAQKAADRANKLGVSGNQQVVDAVHALRDAIFGVSQARIGEANAQRQLMTAQKQAALQMQASGNAASKYAHDLALLSGPQRQLLHLVQGFYGTWKNLEALAAKAVLPGITEFVRGLHSMMPLIQRAFSGFGKVFSDIMAHVGRLFQNKQFRADLESIVHQGITFMRTLQPLEGFFRSLISLWAHSGSASKGFAKAIAEIATGFGHMFKAMEPAAKPIGQILEILGKAIGSLGGPLGSVLSAFFKALEPALKALLPGFRVLVHALGKGLVDGIKAVAPLLVPLAKAMTDLAIGLAPVLPLLAQMTEQLIPLLMPILTDLLPLFDTFAQLMGPLIQAISPLIGPLSAMATGFGLVAPILDGILKAIVPFINNGLKLLVDWVTKSAASWSKTWHGFSDDSKRLWHDITSWITGHLGDFFSWVARAFRTSVKVVGDIWGGIKTVMSAPVNFAIRYVYDDGIRKLWNMVANAVGLKTLDLPYVAPVKLQRGGRLAGYGGGDVLPALLEPGETVVDKDRSRALAPVFQAAGVPGYAHGGPAGHPGGGFFGGIGHWFGGLFGHLLDVGKIVAALASGNSTALMNALGHFIKTSAHGDLARLMVALPKTLFTDAAHALLKLFGSGSGGSSSGGYKGPGLTGNAGANERLAQRLATGYGWGGGLQWQDYVNVAMQESGFNQYATNPQSGAYGIAQALPPSKYPVAARPAYLGGSSDPGAQIGWMLSYISGRYGSPAGAWAHEQAYHWYDKGGFLPPGMSVAVNRTGRPEAVLTADQTRALVMLADRMARHGGASGPVVNQFFYGQKPTAEEKAEMRRDMALTLGGG